MAETIFLKSQRYCMHVGGLPYRLCEMDDIGQTVWLFPEHDHIFGHSSIGNWQLFVLRFVRLVYELMPDCHGKLFRRFVVGTSPINVSAASLGGPNDGT